MKHDFPHKSTLFIDMDGVLVDFDSGVNKLEPWQKEAFEDHYDSVPSIYSMMDPMEGAVESFIVLATFFNVYIASTAPWYNPSGWSDKRIWVENHLGEDAHKRLILTHNKGLLKGDVLVDDRKRNGAEYFSGSFVLFGSDEFPDWEKVTKYLLETFI